MSRQRSTVPVYETCNGCGLVTIRPVGGRYRRESRTGEEHTAFRCRSARDAAARVNRQP